MLNIVTCYGPDGWEKYAKAFVESFQAHWPKSVKLFLFHHDTPPPPVDAENIEVVNLADVPVWVKFKEAYGSINGRSDKWKGEKWEFNVAKFGNKPFAISEAMWRLEGRQGYLMWLDADTITQQAVPMDQIARELTAVSDVAVLERPKTFIESSLMVFNTESKKAAHLVGDVEEIFARGNFRRYAEWHDGFIYDTMIGLHKAHGLDVVNWSPNAVGGLGSDAFGTSFFGGFMKHFKGYLKDSRMEVCHREIERMYDVTRFVFNEDSDLAKAAELIKAASPETDGFVFTALDEKELTKLADTYFGGMPQGFKPMMLNTHKGACTVFLRDKLEYPNTQVDLKIVPKDCVPIEVTHANIKRNIELISKWIKPCRPHGERCIVASAGPTLSEALDELREQQSNGVKIFAVKHSLPMLLNAGIVPWACVILDPRPFDGISTHNVPRRKLLANVNPLTLYMVASMTMPDVTEYLLSQNARVWGWHGWSDAAAKFSWPEGTSLITGGTCAAMRAISIAHSLGFRECDLYGFDFALLGEPSEAQKVELDDMGRPKYCAVSVKGRDKRFWSTGELLAGAQDLERLAKMQDYDMTFNVYGDSLGQNLWRQAGYQLKPHYLSMLSGS